METLPRQELRRFAADHACRLVVVVGSHAKGCARPDSDLDIAVMPRDGGGDVVETTLALSSHLHRCDLDVIWLPTASWLMWWQVARHGVLCYEQEAGLYRTFCRMAAVRYADSRVWRRRSQEYTRRALQGEWAVETALVRQKLNDMVGYLREMGTIVERAAFETDFTLYRTGERLVELLVECAGAINTEVAQAVAGIPPSDYYSSFFSVVQAGWLESRVAAKLTPLCQLRNLIVHQYERVRPVQLHQTLQDTRASWQAYVQGIHDKLTPLERSL
ncbi:MAG TPA: HepT-like ribonuclease domain-containing protein [Candidatus Xenobia bacterium]|jgi:uncharacterized protein YutE (UPF0331/DUF86 family)/predicted nucleotidyltransferase